MKRRQQSKSIIVVYSVRDLHGKMSKDKQIQYIRTETINNHGQLELLIAANSFQPVRSPPPTPSNLANALANEERSYFSDSSDSNNSGPFSPRRLKFRRGSSKKAKNSPNLGLVNFTNDLTSVDSIDIAMGNADSKPLKQPRLPYVATPVSTRAPRPPKTILKSSTWPQTPSPRDHEFMKPMLVEEFEHRRKRGEVPPWRLMVANRKKSREGKFLRNGTLRRVTDEQKSSGERSPGKKNGAVYFG
jgi:hypothetical protein